MNYYGLAQPVRAWLAGLELAGQRARPGTAPFADWMQRAQAAIPYANQLAQLNLLGSHDTPRLLSELGGDLARLQLALTLLFTRPGVPCICYGDEIGLEGGPDPDCRRCFDWDRRHWQAGLWSHVQRLAQARRRRREWQQGATLTLAQGPDWLAYARYTDRAATVVVVNRGPAVTAAVPLQRLPLRPPHWQDWDGAALAADEELMLPLPACGSCIVASPLDKG